MHQWEVKLYLFSYTNLVVLGFISLIYSIFGFYKSASKVFQSQQFLTTHNKFAKLAHFVRWTAAHLHKCGFAAQNFTTLVQIRISRLQRRYGPSVRGILF